MPKRSCDTATVGFAFLPKKLPRVLTGDLRALAAAVGLELVALDPHTPLQGQEPNKGATQQQLQEYQRELPRELQDEQLQQGKLSELGEGAEQRLPAAQPQKHQEQALREGQDGAEGPCRCDGSPGPPAPAPAASTRCGFDVIVHKLHQDLVWEAHLADYALLRPHVQLLDPPPAIHATEDRAVMLAALPPAGLTLRVSLAGTEPCGNTQPRKQLRRPQQPQQETGQQPMQPQQPQQQPQQGCKQSLPPPQSPARTGQQHPAESPLSAPRAGVDHPGQVEAGAEVEAEVGSEADRAVTVRVLAPEQRVIRSRGELRELAHQGTGLKPPLIIKTQRTDAAGDSGHGLAVALSWDELEERAEGLQRAATDAAAAPAAADVSASAGPAVGWVPLVVQQYVPHTEDLYKVYVLGRHVRVTRRVSLTLDRLQALAASSQAQHPHHLPPPPPAGPHGQQQEQQQQQVRPQDGASDAPPPQPPPAVLQKLSAEPLRPRPPAPPTTGPVTAVGTGGHPASEPRGGDAGASGSAQHAPEEAGTATAGLAAAGATAADAAGATAPAAASEAAAGGEACGRARGWGENGAVAVMEAVFRAVSEQLSVLTGLTMFNFDVVVPATAIGSEAAPKAAETRGSSPSGPTPAPAIVGSGGGGGGEEGRPYGDPAAVLQLYVVDINYFPGYDKLDGWESLLVEHLRQAADRAAAAEGRAA